MSSESSVEIQSEIHENQGLFSVVENSYQKELTHDGDASALSELVHIATPDNGEYVEDAVQEEVEYTTDTMQLPVVHIVTHEEVAVDTDLSRSVSDVNITATDFNITEDASMEDNYNISRDERYVDIQPPPEVDDDETESMKYQHAEDTTADGEEVVDVNQGYYVVIENQEHEMPDGDQYEVVEEGTTSIVYAEQNSMEQHGYAGTEDAAALSHTGELVEQGGEETAVFLEEDPATDETLLIATRQEVGGAQDPPSGITALLELLNRENGTFVIVPKVALNDGDVLAGEDEEEENGASVGESAEDGEEDFEETASDHMSDLTVKHVCCPCEECPETFSEITALKEHVITHISQTEEGDKYVCVACKTAFDSKDDAESHGKSEETSSKHDNNGTNSWKCYVCQSEFDDQIELNKHVFLHVSNDVRYECEICKQTFLDDSTLCSHVCDPDADVEIKPYQCDHCDKIFVLRGDLIAHQVRHTNVKINKCVICDKEFAVFRDLQRHLLIHTGEKPFKCTMCGDMFRHSNSLKIHMVKHKDGGKEKCDVCDREFNSKANLINHMRIHTGEKHFKCNICDERFTHYSTMKAHWWDHKEETPFKCAVCNKSFNRGTNLKKHMRTHTDEKPFPCESCHKSFKTTTDLKRHMRTHSGHKPYSCEICTKSFTQHCTLARHLKTHKKFEDITLYQSVVREEVCGVDDDVETPSDGSMDLKMESNGHEKNDAGFDQEMEMSTTKDDDTDKENDKINNVDASKSGKFICPICGKSYANRFTLRFHNRLHTGEKPYKCDECGEAFMHHSTWQSHKLKHTNEEKYKCMICEKNFSRDSNLRKHLRIHTGEKPFTCETCGKGFTTKYDCKRHTKIHFK